MNLKKYYLVYKITNNLNDKIYIGVHSTNKIDDDYMGSGNLIIKSIEKYGIENFTKEVLFDLSDKDEMYEMEAKLVNKEFIQRDDTYNLSLGGDVAYDTSGYITVKDKNGNTFLVSVTDPRYLSGELVGISKNTVVVKDKYNNIFQVDKNESKYLSGEYVGITFGCTISEEHKRKIGKANSKHQKGSKNSNYGKCWIYNIKLKESKSINKEELQQWLDKDWKKGRKIKF